MNEWYVEDSSYPTPDLRCAEQPAGAPQGSANPSCLASQLRELLDEDRELDASFLEESWRSGLPFTSTSYRRNRDRGTENDKDVTFAEPGTAGSFLFSQANGLMADRPADTYLRPSTRSYAAACLPDPREEFSSRKADQVPVRDPADYKWHVDDTSSLGSMTYPRARELLGVSGDSTATQIRTAYRRMVSEWHPDRLERSGETVQAFATKQMAAINEAYHLLRYLSLASVC